jgi:hypothetical protein
LKDVNLPVRRCAEGASGLAKERSRRPSSDREARGLDSWLVVFVYVDGVTDVIVVFIHRNFAGPNGAAEVGGERRVRGNAWDNMLDGWFRLGIRVWEGEERSGEGDGRGKGIQVDFMTVFVHDTSFNTKDNSLRGILIALSNGVVDCGTLGVLVEQRTSVSSVEARSLLRGRCCDETCGILSRVKRV